MEEMPGPAEKEAVQPQKKSLEILAYQERLRAAVQKFLQPVRAFLVRRLGERRAARVLNLLAIPVQYFYDMKFSGYEKTGFSLVRQFWRAGWLGRVGLLAVLAGTLLTAAALASLSGDVEPGATGLTPLALVISLAMLTLGWSFALTAAIQLPLWGYVLVCAYLAWYGILTGAASAGTFLFSLPTLWMVFIGWRLARVNPSRWRWLWLLILGVGAGHLTFAALGLSRLVPDQYNLAGRFVLGLVYFVLLNNRLSLRKFSDQFRSPSRGLVFCGSVVVIGLFLGLSANSDLAATKENLLLSMRSMLGVVDLFWFWLGWSLFEGGISLAEWFTKKAIRVIRMRAARIVIPIVWLLCTFFGWIATHPVPMQLVIFSKKIGLQDWMLTWSTPVYFAVQGSVYAGIAVMLIAAILALLHRLTQKRLVLLTSLWAASYLGISGYYESLSAFATLEEDAAAQLSFFAGLSLVGGILWKLAKSGVSFWETRSRGRLMTLAAILLMMLCISGVTLGARLPDLVMEYTLYSFFGVIYLGFPLTLMKLLPVFTEYQPPRGLGLFALFGLGCLSASIVMMINPYAGPHMTLAPILWLIVLIWLGKRLARMQGWMDGMVAGSALALGFITFWLAPQALPIPFIVEPNLWQRTYLDAQLNRPLLEEGQVWITLAALIAGGLMGFICYAVRRAPLKIAIGLVVGVSLAFVVPVLPGVPTAAPAAVAEQPAEETPATPTPLPGGVIPQDWVDTPLEGTGMALALPPDWIQNPNEVKGLLVNQFAPDGNALFSASYYEGFMDIQKAAQINIEALRTTQNEYKVLSGPEERVFGNWRGVRVENTIPGSDIVDVYIALPGGTLYLNLLCTPGQLADWTPVMEKIAASLHVTP